MEVTLRMLRFTKDHEYVYIEDGIGTMGISEFAQQQLGDVVFVELPSIGRSISKGTSIAVVESVKAASEVYAPLSGEVIECNSTLEAHPAYVNEDPLGKGWFLKIRLTQEEEAQELMDPKAYADYLASLA